MSALPVWPGVIEHYRGFLPVALQDRIITLMEGNTPLLRCDWLGAAIRWCG